MGYLPLWGSPGDRDSVKLDKMHIHIQVKRSGVSGWVRGSWAQMRPAGRKCSQRRHGEGEH